MAAGFKTATVASGDVPATQTDFPSYVDLSRLGITTLAEAQSVRVYADSGKTTEWAREIVSATEMHVKVPSLTSTTSIYVDWDGSSADYAATDTYGRNAVWSGYRAVYHLEDTTDATGGGFTLTNTGVVPFSTYYIGKGADFTPNDSLNNNSVGLSTYPRSFSTIVNWDALTSEQAVISQSDGSTHYYTLRLRDSDNHIIFRSNNATQAGDVDTSITAVAGQNYKIRVTQHSTTSVSIYVDGTKTNTTAATFVATVSQLYFGYLGRSSAWYLDGQMDETRMINSAPSDDWETTEYNNQSDEAGFWGTWSDVGGGGGATYVPKSNWFM